MSWHSAALFIKCMMLQHRTTLRSLKIPMRMSIYLGTSQPGELQAGTNTAPILKSKKKKSTKPKTEDKAEEATLRERRKADHEMAHRILYAEDFPAIQALRLCLNLPRAGDPNMDMSSELEFMDQEW